MLEVKRISFDYHEVEDRLHLDCGDGQTICRLLLTRRITRRLLSSFAQALVASSPAVSRAPADARREVMVLEHFASLAVPAPPAEPVAAGAAEATSDLGQTVVWKVDVTIEPVLFKLTLTRGDFHKVLAALDRVAEAADWNIRAEAGWLDGAEALVTSASGRTAS